MKISLVRVLMQSIQERFDRFSFTLSLQCYSDSCSLSREIAATRFETFSRVTRRYTAHSLHVKNAIVMLRCIIRVRIFVQVASSRRASKLSATIIAHVLKAVDKPRFIK